MAELPFWDEECLRGSIDRGPLPPPPRSLFESDLFCNEDVENDPLPPISSPNDFLFSHQDAFGSPARVPASPSRFLNATPPLIRHPPPLAMSPIRPLADSPARLGWKSFLDDNCPLRKRVKVTITPATRARRSLGFSSPEPPTKKSRLSPPRPVREQLQHPVSRRRQTTLRLSRSGDLAGRIMLHLPSNSSTPSSPQSTKHTSARSKLTNSNTNDSPDITMQERIQNLAFESHSADHPHTHPELDLDADLERGFDADCSKLEDNCSFGESLQAAFENLPHQSSHDPSAHMPRAIPVKNNPRLRAGKRDYITNDLSQRLSFVTQNVPVSPTFRQDSGLMVPLVDAAVQAVTRAAQRYSSLVTKVSSSPPAVVLADAWRVPKLQSSGQNQQRQASRGRNIRRGKAGKTATKRKRSRRRRTLLSFDDHDVEPLKDSRDDAVNNHLDETSALARYLNSPSSSRTEALAC